ncbi:hypothetical protein D3C83_58470 [compost metagenome]
MLVYESQYLVAGRRDQRPERHARCPARRNPYAAAQREHRIENGAGGIGKRPAIHHRDRLPDLAAAAEEAGAVGFDLGFSHRFSLDYGKMRGPNSGLAR